MEQEAFQQIAQTIPLEPGIYKYFGSNKELLYVGKAKNLRKRVSSYFNKTLSNYKTYDLVKRIHSIEFTLVNSEQDAFLLENSLNLSCACSRSTDTAWRRRSIKMRS